MTTRCIVILALLFTAVFGQAAVAAPSEAVACEMMMSDTDAPMGHRDQAPADRCALSCILCHVLAPAPLVQPMTKLEKVRLRMEPVLAPPGIAPSLDPPPPRTVS